MNVVSPMILDSSGNVLRRIDPVDVSLDLQLQPLSSAEIELKPGDYIPARSWVSVYTEHGLAGIFRSKPQRDRYGERSSRVSLVHGACELNDYLTTKGGDQQQDPANTAIAYIMQFYLGTHWRLGTVSATAPVVYQLNGSGVLDAIAEIMDQLPGYMLTFDQSVTPWTLNVLPRPETVSAEGRLSRNISSVEISRDDTSLCTRVYYGENDLFVEDAAAIQKYGVIEYRINESGLTNVQLAAIAQAYLDNHKESKLSVSISAIDFYNATGEPLDRIALGSKYRLAIPDAETEENRVIEAIICSIHYDSVRSRNPQITLASDPDTIITFLKKQRRSGGSARQIAKEEAQKQYEHFVEETDAYRLEIYRINGVEFDPDTGKVIYQTDPVTGEVIVDDAGNPVPVYNEESDGSIASQVIRSAQQISQKVTQQDVDRSLVGYMQTTAWESKMGNYLIVNQDGEKVMKGIAEVVTMINNQNEGIVNINGNRVIVNATNSATIANTVYVNPDGAFWVKRNAVFGPDGGPYTTINGSTIKAATVQVNSGGSLIFGGSPSEQSPVASVTLKLADAQKLKNMSDKDVITGVQIAGPVNNVYTLQFQKASTGNTWNNADVSFSRATTLYKSNYTIDGTAKTAGWSSGTFTVRAEPQNESISTRINDIVLVSSHQDSTIKKQMDVTLKVMYDNEQDDDEDGETGFTKTNMAIDATPIYTAGQDSVVSTFDTPASVPSTVTPTDLLKGTVRRYHVTKDGTDVVDSYFRVPNYSATLTPASTSGTKTTLSDGVYGLYVTKDGSAEQTPIAYYEVSGGTGADPKVSKSEWQNGSTTFTAGTSGQSSIPVSLSIVPTTNWSAATVPVNPTFRIDDGQSSTGLTGTFRLQVDNDYVYVKSNTDNPVIGTNVLARQTNGAYSAGQQSVSALLVSVATQSTAPETLTAGDYGLFRTINGTAESTPIKYVRVASGGSGGTRTARQLLTPGGEDTITLAATDTETSSHNLVAYYTSGTDTTTLPIKIDAKEVYDAGVTAGLGGVVNVVKQPWAGNTCEFRPSAGNGTSASVTITAEATKVAPASATETGEIVLKDGDNQITTKNLYLRPRTLDGQSYIVLTDTSSIVSMGNILAKYSASGGGSESSVYAIVQNGTITYSSDYQTAFVPVAAKDENGTTLLSSSIAADITDAWENGYTEGLTDGSGMEVQDTKDIRSNPITSNNSDIRIDPDGSALAMGHVRLAVNVPQEITDVALFRSNDSVSTYNTWSGYTVDKLTTKYAQLSIAQANGTNAYVKIDASDVYERGVAAGADTAGYRLTTVELAGTPNYFRSINVPTGTTTVNAVTGSGALYQVDSNGSLYLCSVEVSRTVQGYLYQNNGSGFERVPGTGNGSWFYVDGNVTRLMKASNLKVAAASTAQYTVATGSRQAYVTDSSGSIVFYTQGRTVADTYYIKTT